MKINTMRSRLLFRVSIVLLLSFVTSISFAQKLTYTYVESTSYALYSNAQWKELVELGGKVDFDYYYFNIRMGIAQYHLKNYYSAEKYLIKAIANQKTDFALKHLFWNYINLGENEIAAQIYAQLSEKTKESLSYKKSVVQSIYIEAGFRSPDNADVGNTLFGNIALHHRLGNKISIRHSFNTLKQTLKDKVLNSKQYNLSGNYSFKYSAIGVGGSISSSQLIDNSNLEASTGLDIIASNNSVFVNFKQRIHRLSLNANISYVSQHIDYQYFYRTLPPIRSIESGFSILEDRTSLIPSIGLSYTPKILKERVSFGAIGFVSLTEGNINFIVKPQLIVSFHDKLWVKFNYLHVNNDLFLDYSSEILYSNLTLSSERFSSTINYLFSPNLSTFLTYTHEKISDSFQEINYNTNSIFLGFQFRF
jgi:hypothetical protein